MGRRLPWKTSEDTSTPRPQSPKVESSELPPLTSRTARTPTSTDPRTPLRKRMRLADSSDPLRSPSTSPPPEPPPQMFMVPGLANDDRYRMVEDELLHTAQKFTTHLHRAEYNRLKTLAKSQNAAAIREIERPVIGGAGSMTTTVRRRRDVAAKGARQRQGLRQARGDGAAVAAAEDVDEDSTPWTGTSLQGLMESPRKDGRVIPSRGTGPSNTRAAAGFDASRAILPSAPPHCAAVDVDRETTEGDEDDDTETSPIRPTRVSAAPSNLSTPAESRTRTWPMSSSTRTSSAGKHTPESKIANRVHGTISSRKTATPSRIPKADDDDGNDDPFGMRSRRLRREKSKDSIRKTPSKKLSPDTIPSFI